MPSSLTTFFIIGAVCLIFGAFAGYLLGSIHEIGDGGSPNDEPAPPGGKKGKYEKIARLWREKKSEALVIEVDGQTFVDPDALEQGQHERLERCVQDFFQWMKAEPEVAPQPVVSAAPETQMLPAQPAAVVPPMVAPPVAAPPVAAAVRLVEQAPVEKPVLPKEPASPATNPPYHVVQNPMAPPASPAVSSNAPVMPLPVQPPAKSAPAAFVASIGQPAKKIAPVVKSMVEQIDEVIQEMIVGTKFENKDIMLTEDPRRGVIVRIGASIYEGIGSVPDPEIQNFLRSAVAEWERRQDLLRSRK